MATKVGSPLITIDELDMGLAESDALAELAQAGMDVSPQQPADEMAVDEFIQGGGDEPQQDAIVAAPDRALRVLGDYLVELRQYGIDERWGLDENTMMNIAFRHGHQFVEVDRSRRAVVEIPAPQDTVRRSINRFEPWYRTQHSKLSSGVPDYHLRPKNRQLTDRDAARYADELAEWIIPMAFGPQMRSECAMWKLLAGNVVLYAGLEWVPDEMYAQQTGLNSRPDLVFEAFPPHMVWGDLRAESIERSRYLGIDRPITVSEARAMFPESAHLILPEGVSPERMLAMRNRGAAGMLAPDDPFGLDGNVTPGPESRGLESEDDTIICEFWGRPGIVLQASMLDQLPGDRIPFEVIETHAGASLDPLVRFPMGLFVAFTTQGDVLAAAPNPFEFLPFRVMKFSQSPGLFGPAPATPLRPVQQAINWVESLRESGIELTGAPKILQPIESRMRRRGFIAGAVQYVKYRANRFGAKPEYMNPPNLPADLVQFENRLDLVWQDLAGTHDSYQGKLPSGDMSGVAISLLQEQDLSQLGYAGSDEEDGFIEILQMSFRHVQQFFPSNDPRLINIAGDAPYLLRAFLGAQIKEGLDVQVVRGSSIPRSPAAVESKAKEAWTMGALVDRYGRPDARRLQEVLGFGTADELFAEEELDIQNARAEEDFFLSLAPEEAALLLMAATAGQIHPLLIPKPEDDGMVHEYQHRMRLKLLRQDPRATPFHVELVRMHWGFHVQIIAPLLQQTDPGALLGAAGTPQQGMLGPGQQQGQDQQQGAPQAAGDER